MRVLSEQFTLAHNFGSPVQIIASREGGRWTLVGDYLSLFLIRSLFAGSSYQERSDLRDRHFLETLQIGQ